MAILPKNEPRAKDISPRVFLLWGASMSGKTYLAREFPNPILLSTDGNWRKVDTPSIEIKSFKNFSDAIQELETEKHTFETIIIDLVDDIKTFMENYICEEAKIETLADAPFGKAYGRAMSIWKQMMIRISKMPFNVIMISHIKEVTDESDNTRTIQLPSLEQKYLNVSMGRCDVVIKCRKIGNNYMRLTTEKRDQYMEKDVKNIKIREIMKTIKGLFDTDTPVSLPKREQPAKKPALKVEEPEDEPEVIEEPKPAKKPLILKRRED